MLQASPRVLHLKCILDFGEGQGTRLDERPNCAPQNRSTMGNPKKLWAK
jgi:hypothetical protein